MRSIIATGYRNEQYIQIKCSETQFGLIEILVNNEFDKDIFDLLKQQVYNNWVNGRNNYLAYQSYPTTLEAYYTAIYESNIFDDDNFEIEVNGELNLNGLPYEDINSTHSVIY